MAPRLLLELTHANEQEAGIAALVSLARGELAALLRGEAAMIMRRFMISQYGGRDARAVGVLRGKQILSNDGDDMVLYSRG